MTQPILPSGGGSYERLADGSLKVVEQPLATHDTTTEAVPAAPETEGSDAGSPKPKAGRAATTADLKEV